LSPNQRVPEFGVRMALGAGARDVLLRQSVGMIVVGSALALLALWPQDGYWKGWCVGACGGPIYFHDYELVLAALSASFLPARRASRLDPLKALRQK